MKYAFVLAGVVLGLCGAWYVLRNGQQQLPAFPLSPSAIVPDARPLDAYTIDNLTKRQGIGSEIVLDQAVATTSAYTVYVFHFTSGGKKVTGLAHLPAQAGIPGSVQKFPVIVQLRGYVDHSIYSPGIGTRRSAEVFASNGYISLAPDFLGYGGSDNPGSDVFEERFQTYTTVLDLLASVSSLPMVDAAHVGIWAHSNGGQIALTVLEITGLSYPTTLWAPVTKPFPYSILYYTDEAEDHGRALRKKLSDFEKKYDADRYAMTNFISRITAPVQLHQGTEDDAVPLKWNDEFVADMKKEKINIEYYTYPGADHNMNPSPARNATHSVAGGWNAVIVRDISFFDRYLTEPEK